jgi:cytohesin
MKYLVPSLSLALLVLFCVPNGTWAQGKPGDPGVNAKLIEASKQGDRDALSRLLAQGADPNTRDEESSRTALFHVLAKGDANGIQLLLERGADPNLKDANGITPLMVAASLPREIRLQTVRMLVDAGADMNAQNANGETALTIAARNESNETVLFLIEKGATADLRYAANMALLRAAQSGSVAEIRFLLENGANVNTQPISYTAKGEVSYRGDTPLMHAIKRGHRDAVAALLKAGANPSTLGSAGQTPLVAAVTYGNFEMIAFLLDSGARFDKKEITREVGKFATLYVSKSIGALLSDGSDVDAKDATGRTALMLAAQEGHAGTVKILLYLGSSVNLRDQREMTPLLHAVRNGRDSAVGLLLSAGADANARDNHNFPALMLALPAGGPPFDSRRTNSTTIIRALLDSGADPNARVTGGFTTLMLAAVRGHTEAVETLLARGADVHAKAEYSLTAYHLASGEKVIALLNRARAAPVAPVWTPEKSNPAARDRRLKDAAQDGDYEFVEILLREGTYVDSLVYKFDQTALFYAAEGYDPRIVRLLLRYGADPNRRGIHGSTVFSKVIDSVRTGDSSANAIEKTNMLLDAGADVNAQDSDGRTPIALAASQGLPDLLRLLLSREGNPNIADRWGKTPLKAALESKQKHADEVVKILKDAGAK